MIAILIFFPKHLRGRPEEKNKIKIGILGVISHNTKDYKPVFKALELLTEEEKSKIEFINVAYCPNANENDIIKKLREHCSVSITPGHLNTEQFDRLGSECHLLISPLKEEIEYGTFKGSGSFGDMVYLRRKTFMPLYCDPNKDYDQICHYYSDHKDLARLLRDSSKIIKEDINEDFIDSFSTKNIRKKLLEDLKLPC